VREGKDDCSWFLHHSMLHPEGTDKTGVRSVPRSVIPCQVRLFGTGVAIQVFRYSVRPRPIRKLVRNRNIEYMHGWVEKIPRYLGTSEARAALSQMRRTTTKGVKSGTAEGMNIDVLLN